MSSFHCTLVRSWLWEVIAIFISISATLALGVLLRVSNGQPQRIWRVGGTQLTLNALVATLSTIMRTTNMLAVAGALNQGTWNWFTARKSQQHTTPRLLGDLETFSEASTTSWNSLRLLYRTKCRRLVSLGALVIILSFPFDVFTQQTVTAISQSLPTGPPLSAENALPRARAFINAWYSTQISGVFGLYENYALAITSGVTDSNSSRPGATCPTGNCTWPTTPTLALCSVCEDVRAQLQTEQGDDSVTYSLPWPSNQFSLAGASSVMFQWRNGSTPEGKPFSFSQVFSISTGSKLSLSDRGRMTVAMFQTIGLNDASLRLNNTIPFTIDLLEPAMTAFSCSFYFCLRADSASSIDGTLEWHTTVEPWDQTQSDGTGSWSFVNIPQQFKITQDEYYGIEGSSVYALGQYLQKFLNGSVGVSIGYGGLYSDNSKTEQSDEVLERIYMASGSLANISAMCQAITNQFDAIMSKSSAGGTLPLPSEQAYGPTVYAETLLVQVRWAWFAYPTAVVALSILFLGLTIHTTHQHRLYPFKGQRLPLLLATTDEYIHEIAKESDAEHSDLRKQIGSLRVRMSIEGNHNSIHVQAVKGSTV